MLHVWPKKCYIMYDFKYDVGATDKLRHNEGS